MIKRSVSEKQWNGFLARTRALILYISIWIFDLEPETLSGLSRNGPQLSSRFWCSERRKRSDGQTMIAARTRSGLSKCQWQRINLIQLVISAFFYFRYGDKTPKSLLARLFAIVWMVSGIILLSMFTAQVSSRLTAQELRSDHHLFGKKVNRIFPFFSFFSLFFRIHCLTSDLVYYSLQGC